MRYLTFVLYLIIMSCQEKPSFDLQNHRGCRGLMPENTVKGFLHAVKLGVTTLEMDVVISADSQVVVSHEPFFNPDICMDPKGQHIRSLSAKKNNIYKMAYEVVRQYDCGMLPHPGFELQYKTPAYKPLLTEVFETVEADRKARGKIRYNIEIKSVAKADNIYHPEPAVFSDLVYRTIDGRIDWERVTIQSFDFRVLRYFHQTYPEVKLALLIENNLPFQANLDSLGFQPAIYSPYFKRLTQETVGQIRSMGIRVIPWTVNEPDDMKELISWGVDGIITDYPDRFPR